MGRPQILDARKAETWFQALRNPQIITEHQPTARQDRQPTQGPGRAYQCKACSFEPQGQLHWHLLAVKNEKRTLASVAEWTKLEPKILTFHLEHCMKTDVKTGQGDFPSSTVYVMLPSPAQRMREADVLEIIDAAPRAEQTEKTRINEHGRRITTIIRTWNHHEHLLSIWHGSTTRTTLLDGNYLRGETEVKDVAVAVLWFADQVLIPIPL